MTFTKCLIEPEEIKIDPFAEGTTVERGGEKKTAEASLSGWSGCARCYLVCHEIFIWPFLCSADMKVMYQKDILQQVAVEVL
jgi:hypothetical protein